MAGKVQGHRIPRPPTHVDPALRAHLQHQADAVNGLINLFNGARLIEDVTCTAGESTKIAHGLGRRLRGYIIVRINSGAALAYLHDEQTEHTDTDKHLYLRAEGFSPTLSLLVF